jgi:hypothetical protein
MNTTTTIHRTRMILAGLGIGVLSASCAENRINDGHCWLAEGDKTCQEYNPLTPHCASEECGMGAAYGCVADMPVP